jgi:hypothetical protein
MSIDYDRTQETIRKSAIHGPTDREKNISPGKTVSNKGLTRSTFDNLGRSTIQEIPAHLESSA